MIFFFLNKSHTHFSTMHFPEKLQHYADISNLFNWLQSDLYMTLINKGQYVWGGSLHLQVCTAPDVVTWICEAWRSMVIMWSAPATDSMLATSLAEIGARLWNGKHFSFSSNTEQMHCFYSYFYTITAIVLNLIGYKSQAWVSKSIEIEEFLDMSDI